MRRQNRLPSVRTSARPSGSAPFCFQSQQGRGAAGGGGAESQQELSRLKAELDKKVLFYEEELLRKDSAHSGEIKTLRKDLQESEGARLAANKELLQLRDKLDKANRDRRVLEDGGSGSGPGPAPVLNRLCV